MVPINFFVGIRQVGEHFYEDGILRPLFKGHNKVTKDQCKCPGSVRRGTPGVGVILYYGFNNRRCAGKPGRFILWILTKKQMEVFYCHELFIFLKIVRFMPVSWVCECSIWKGFVCTLLVYLRKCRSLLSFFFVSFCSTHFFFWNQTVWKTVVYNQCIFKNHVQFRMRNVHDFWIYVYYYTTPFLYSTFLIQCVRGFNIRWIYSTFFTSST